MKIEEIKEKSKEDKLRNEAKIVTLKAELDKKLLEDYDIAIEKLNKFTPTGFTN